MVTTFGRALLALTAFSVTTTFASTAHAESLRIAHTIWVGFGPLFIAQEKGFFGRAGIEVELIRIEEHTTTYAGLFSGQIDAVAAANDETVSFGSLSTDVQ